MFKHGLRQVLAVFQDPKIPKSQKSRGEDQDETVWCVREKNKISKKDEWAYRVRTLLLFFFFQIKNLSSKLQEKWRFFEIKKKLNTNTNKKKEQTTESFSHWREEFIWETDKKYPDKVKEIKPMTGKNTITINPEDETSKYKRGY